MYKDVIFTKVHCDKHLQAISCYKMFTINYEIIQVFILIL